MIELVKDGTEPGIREVVAWLERQGIPKARVRGVTVSAFVGEPMAVTFTVNVNPSELESEPVELEPVEHVWPPATTDRQLGGYDIRDDELAWIGIDPSGPVPAWSELAPHQHARAQAWIDHKAGPVQTREDVNEP